jgi:hypothetical protein
MCWGDRMLPSLLRAVVVAILVFTALFVLRFFLWESSRSTSETGIGSYNAQNAFDSSRKNYAQTRASVGDSQRYEKIATIAQRTENFDADRKRVEAAITEQGGIIQLERTSGLTGSRLLQLGVGVPPELFDKFVDTVRAIGVASQIEIAKNDKTNEYLQLRAKRTTLEKARAGLEVLKELGGSTDERMKVHNRLIEIEQQIQDLGVALGDFDSQNELCTVKLTLREYAKSAPASIKRRLLATTQWTASVFAGLAGGFLMLVVAGWIGAGLIAFALRILRQARSAESN